MNLMRVMRWTNGLLLLSALLQIATGIMLFFELDALGPLSTSELHKYNGLVFIVLVAVHFWLNWGWFKANFLRRRPVNRLTQNRMK